uniref:Uncharacterized protein n=1 Tax=Pseudomonas phage Cygsa01 TaxID=3138529 RepID=A0AAU6W534_9VIRU
MTAQAKIAVKTARPARRINDSFLRGVKFFTATPDGKVVGRRNPSWNRKTESWEGRVSLELGDDFNPAAIGRNPWQHMCPLVPDDDCEGVYMSHNSYFRLYLEQYARHMTWLYHEKVKQKILFAGLPRHKCIKAGIPYVSKNEKIKAWVMDALKDMMTSIEKQYGIKLNEIDAESLELDAILIDRSESIRDTTRRYGRTNAVRRGAGRA